ncbi:MAG: hypothetical protein ACI9FR_001630 [Cryomorphaceae bacterium]|jgi:hypothetical protein
MSNLAFSHAFGRQKKVFRIKSTIDVNTVSKKNYYLVIVFVMNKTTTHNSWLNKCLRPVQLGVALLTIMGLFGIATAQAQVVSMSKITEVLTDSGSYRQFSVNCGSRSENRFLRKDSDSALWCDAIVGTFCARKRLQAAEIVCGRRYSSALRKLSKNAETSSQITQTETSPEVVTVAKTDTTAEVASTTKVATASPSQVDKETIQAEPRNTEIAINGTESFNPREKQQVKMADALDTKEKPQSREALERELRDIESKLIDIQAQKLDLRAKDLQLMKSQLNQAG